MEHFTPYSALFGGVLIGLSAALLMLFNGRIAGITGIFSGAMLLNGGDRVWRWFFLAGLLLGPLISMNIGISPADIQIDAPTPILIIAGLLVGYGTSLGSGCTSGHGVCGLARLSLRSAAATATFMVVAGVTVFIMRHLLNG